jgi:hypothetical protein
MRLEVPRLIACVTARHKTVAQYAYEEVGLLNRASARQSGMLARFQQITKMAAAAAVFASAWIVTPALAAPEILTVCGSHVADSAGLSSRGGLVLSSLLFSSAEVGLTVSRDSVALTHDQNGYDLIVDWHGSDEHSLRAAGVDILGMELGGLIHLMVRQSSEHVEQYVFTLDEDGSGDLLWSGATSLSDDDASSFACSKPR